MIGVRAPIRATTSIGFERTAFALGHSAGHARGARRQGTFCLRDGKPVATVVAGYDKADSKVVETRPRGKYKVRVKGTGCFMLNVFRRY